MATIIVEVKGVEYYWETINSKRGWYLQAEVDQKVILPSQEELDKREIDIQMAIDPED